MGWLGKGGNSAEISDGGQYQCDCTVGNCPCTRWFTIPKGSVVPSEPRCPQCCGGNHSG